MIPSEFRKWLAVWSMRSAKRQDANEMAERRAAVLEGGLNGTYARKPKTQDEKNLARNAKYAAMPYISRRSRRTH